MRGRVTISARAIASHCERYAIGHDASSDRHFTGCFCFARSPNCLAHPTLVRPLRVCDYLICDG
jgi:hypothetical protein